MSSNTSIQIIEKPDWVSWDDIHDVLWKAHGQNREQGMNMALPALPGEEIKKRIEGNGKMLVAICDDRVVGTAAIKRKTAKLWCGNTEYAYICFASVLPEYNGKGIYKALDIKREELALSMGLDKMLGDTHEGNEHRLSIAKKAGYKFVDLSVWKDHYNVVMVKWLKGCPFSDLYCNIQFQIHKWYRKLRYKPGRGKRFGI